MNTAKKSVSKYKNVTKRIELHGRSIYRTNSNIFKYKSVKFRINGGLS